MGSCSNSSRRFFHVNRSLVPLKATVFFFYGAIFCLIPFLHLHVKYVGLSIPETTITYAILLIASFAGAPIAGYLMDKIGRFKLVFSVVLTGLALSHNALLLVPRVTAHEQPPQAEFLCTHTGAYMFTTTCRIPDLHCPVSDGGDNAVIEFRDCQFKCREPNDTAPFPKMFSTTSSTPLDTMDTSTGDDYDVDLHHYHEERAEMGGHDEPQMCYRPQMPQEHEPEKCRRLKDLVTAPTGNFSLAVATQMYQSKEECVFRLMEARWAEELVTGPHCPANPVGCRLMCDIGLRHGNDSLFTCTHRQGDPSNVFYVYFALRLVCMLFLGAAFSLMETVVLVKAKQHGGDYGKQRVWGSIAKAALIPLAGCFSDIAGNAGQVPFLPIFLMFDLLLAVSFVLVVTSVSLEMSPQPKLRFRDVFDLLSRWDAMLLYFAIFFLGAFWGFLDTFLSPYLLDLGSSEFLLGVSRTVGGLVCIPTMFFADTIMNKVGRVNILIAAFICYAVQMLCYSVIGNPWWSVGLEVLKFFTSCLKVASAVTLANTLAPIRLVATMQGTLHCLQYLIGSGIGHLAAGFLTATYSTRAALRVFGILSSLMGFTYGVSYYSLRNKDHMKQNRAPMSNYESDPQFRDLTHAESRV